MASDVMSVRFHLSQIRVLGVVKDTPSSTSRRPEVQRTAEAVPVPDRRPTRFAAELASSRRDACCLLWIIL